MQMLFSLVGTLLWAHFFTAVDNLIDLNTCSLFVSVLNMLEQIKQHFIADPPPQPTPCDFPRDDLPHLEITTATIQ
jgi:hypothetical protein